MIHLDTHVVVWLYHADEKRFSTKARRKLETESLEICPIVKLELQYLFEIERLTIPADALLENLRNTIALSYASCELQPLVDAALSEAWTRDPFDRFIVAHARISGAVLISADRNVAQNYAKCVW